MSVQKRKGRRTSSHPLALDYGARGDAEYAADVSFIAWVKTHTLSTPRNSPKGAPLGVPIPFGAMVKEFLHHCREEELLASECANATAPTPDGAITAFRVVGRADNATAFRRFVLMGMLRSVSYCANDTPAKVPGYNRPDYSHGPRHASMRSQKSVKRAAHGAGNGAVSTISPVRLSYPDDKIRREEKANGEARQLALDALHSSAAIADKKRREEEDGVVDHSPHYPSWQWDIFVTDGGF